jgi:KaiC/GvpD/RAD55 family RecA-like ATPase
MLFIIYGNVGVGKSSLAISFAYLMLKRNFYKDGIFYFSLDKLNEAKYEKNLINLMKIEFGQQFAKNMNEFFSNKKMLIIFDNFDKGAQSNI